ncbi:MAG TPA: RHS repeat protein, partial [Candidatus Cryptobacteroides merdipullorum]|nr:RHS repeat protein [Candidatus Cryptobacteroides merdipullorum]
MLSIAGITYSLSAQVSVAPEPARPNADTWDFIKYGEISPSLYTGQIRLSIPFYTYKDNDFEIPVSFDYASGGTMPNDRVGILGAGWLLNTGGTITREIRGVPDDYMTNAVPLQFGYADVCGYYFTAASDEEFSDVELYSLGGPWQDSMICLYVKHTGEGYEFFDAEPDIFHFNFLGRSGSFMISEDGSIMVFGTDDNPNGFSIEIGFEDGHGTSPIAVTTSDGFRYEFDGYQNGNNTEKIYPKGRSVITSWKLSRIVAPNGRTAEFDYFNTQAMQSRRPASVCFAVYSFSGYSWDFTGLDVGNDQCTLSTPEYSVARPVSITVSGGTEITFDYESTTEILYSSDFEKEDETMQRLGSGRLVKASVTHDGDTVKVCRLQYDNDNPAHRNFLTSIEMEGEGIYSMDYRSPDGLPIYGTFKIDHWGYYNGNDDTHPDFLKVTRLTNNDRDEEYLPDNPRAADAEYAGRGMLTRLTYPTGGYTDFFYEPHDYSRIVKRLSSSNYRPVLVSESGTAGGLRISAVKSYESDGTLLSSENFQYGSGRHSSGILTHLPRYSVKFSTSVKEYETYGTIWSNNLTRFGETHIEYDEVTRIDADGGMTSFHFTTSEDYPDIIENKGYIIAKLLGTQGGMDEWTIPSDSLANLFTNTSMQKMRGRLISTDHIRADGDTLQSIKTDYVPAAGIPEFSYAPKYLFYALARTGEYTGHTLRDSDEEITRYGEVSVNRRTEYSYNDMLSLASTSELDSDGILHVTQYRYTGNNQSGINAEMYAKGFIETPVSEAEYVQYPGEDQMLVRRTSYTYLKPDTDAHPDLYRIATATDYDPVSGKSSVTSYEYDSLGNLVEATDPDGVSTVYIWGHGGLHLVAAVGNATIEQVEDA